MRSVVYSGHFMLCLIFFYKNVKYVTVGGDFYELNTIFLNRIMIEYIVDDVLS